MSSVRCYSCKGLKQVVGIGGITRDCRICDGVGKIDATEAMKQTELPAVSAPIESDITAMSLNEAVVEIDAIELKSKIDLGVSSEMQPVQNDAVNVDTPPVMDLEPKYIAVMKKSDMAHQLGVTDELLDAVLDEPRIEAGAWRKRYAGVAGLLGPNGVDEIMTKVERASLRERYALLQPIAPRKVNLAAAQDEVTKTDVEYLKFKASEDAKRKTEEAKKVGKK